MKIKNLTKVTNRAAIMVEIFIGTIMSPVIVSANGVGTVTRVMKNIPCLVVSFIISIVETFGAVWIVKAFSGRDTVECKTRVEEFVGGLTLFIISGILAVLTGRYLEI